MYILLSEGKTLHYLKKCIFPSFCEIYPNQDDWLLWKHVRMRIRFGIKKLYLCKQFKKICIFLNNKPHWQILFHANPQRFEALFNTFCNKDWNKYQRVQAIIDNFNLAEQLWGQLLCDQLLQQQRILIADLDNGLKIYLNINQIDACEGFFSINFQNEQQQRLYDASFALIMPNQLLITSIQGPKAQPEMVKLLTKQLYGIRPMFMLVVVLKLLAQQWDCELFGIVHRRQAKYRWNDSSRLLFHYDDFWRENDAILSNHSSYWLLPKHIEHRNFADIPSKKRSMYRKRYEMLKHIEDRIQCLFKK